MSAVHTLEFAPGQDLSFELYVPPALDAATGAALPYPDVSITGWIAEGGAPSVALNGTVKTFPRFAVGRFVWFFDATEVAACLAQVSPSPVDGAVFYAVAKGANNFLVHRRLSYRAVRVVP